MTGNILVLAVVVIAATMATPARARDRARAAAEAPPPVPGAGFGPGPPGMPPPPRPLGPGPRALESLDLTDPQRDRIEDLHDVEMRQVMRLDVEARIAERDLERLLFADQVQARAIDELTTKIAALRADLLRARVASLVALREVLTPAQRARLRRLSL